MRAPPPFALTANHGTEDHLHEAVAKLLDIMLLPPVQWSTFPAGGDLAGPAAARLYRLGLKTGWPDIIIAYRGIYGIELKGWGGKLSQTRKVRNKRTGAVRTVIGQETMHLWLKEAGMQLAVCRSLQAVAEQVVAWKLPHRNVAL